MQTIRKSDNKENLYNKNRNLLNKFHSEYTKIQMNNKHKTDYIKDCNISLQKQFRDKSLDDKSLDNRPKKRIKYKPSIEIVTMLLDLIPVNSYTPFKINVNFENYNLKRGIPYKSDICFQTKRFFEDVAIYLNDPKYTIDFKDLLSILHLSKINCNYPITTYKYIKSIYQLIKTNLGESFELLQKENMENAIKRVLEYYLSKKGPYQNNSINKTINNSIKAATNCKINEQDKIYFEYFIGKFYNGDYLSFWYNHFSNFDTFNPRQILPQ
jgi:hypothetical protein